MWRCVILQMKVNIIVMSGLEDGTQYTFNAESDDGTITDNNWSITVGRRDENDLTLKNDTFISRQHALLHYHANQWWLEDKNSTNGTFTENADQFFMDSRVTGTVLLDTDLMFRVGRTWLKIDILE